MRLLGVTRLVYRMTPVNSWRDFSLYRNTSAES
jgi:hypothetical protein